MIYDLRLEFSFLHTNDKMKLYVDNEEIPSNNGKGVYCQKISLPHALWLRIAGKNEDKDTILDKDIIVKDRHIRLINISLNGVRPPTNFIRKWPLLHVGGRNRNQKIYSHYWGFNGEVELDFQGNDLVSWLMKTNEFRDDHWHKNSY